MESLAQDLGVRVHRETEADVEAVAVSFGDFGDRIEERVTPESEHDAGTHRIDDVVAAERDADVGTYAPLPRAKLRDAQEVRGREEEVVCFQTEADVHVVVLRDADELRVAHDFGRIDSIVVPDVE